MSKNESNNLLHKVTGNEGYLNEALQNLQKGLANDGLATNGQQSPQPIQTQASFPAPPAPAFGAKKTDSE